VGREDRFARSFAQAAELEMQDFEARFSQGEAPSGQALSSLFSARARAGCFVSALLKQAGWPAVRSEGATARFEQGGVRIDRASASRTARWC